MNYLELDSFLRNHTFLEECFLRVKKMENKSINEIESIANSIVYDESSKRKLPSLSKESQIEALTDSSNLFVNKSIADQSESITFSIHPRFVATDEHRHPFIEIIYVYSGKCNQTINNKKIVLEEGEICILDTNVLHSIEPVSENDIIVNCIMSTEYIDNILISRLSGNDLLSSFFIRAIYQSKDFNNYIVFNSSNSDKIKLFMKDILCAYWDIIFCLDEVLNSYMILIFSELISIYSVDTNIQNYSTLNNTKISDIILFVQNNYKTATVISTAKHFHFHPDYLSKTVKKLTGKNFTDIVHEARLKRDCIILRNSDMSVTQIANEVGYENINFFYKIFKRYFNCTPSKYKEIYL